MCAYQVRLPVFEGPLDLLLQLIERRRLDVTTVSLALVTDQYLEHLRAGQGVDPEQLSEFVAVAAKLLLIKSRALLPRPEPSPADDSEPVPDDPTDLTERLREYEAIRRAVAELRRREEADLRSYPHVPPAGLVSLLRAGYGRSPDPCPSDHPNGHARGAARASPRGLLLAYRRIASQRPPEPVEVERQVWPVAEAVAWLLGALRGPGANGHASAAAPGPNGSGRSDSSPRRLSFRRLVAGFPRTRLVGAFLALLELHRQGLVLARQAEPFADIELSPPEGAEAPAGSDSLS